MADFPKVIFTFRLALENYLHLAAQPEANHRDVDVVARTLQINGQDAAEFIEKMKDKNLLDAESMYSAGVIKGRTYSCLMQVFERGNFSLYNRTTLEGIVWDKIHNAGRMTLNEIAVLYRSYEIPNDSLRYANKINIEREVDIAIKLLDEAGFRRDVINGAFGRASVEILVPVADTKNKSFFKKPKPQMVEQVIPIIPTEAQLAAMRKALTGLRPQTVVNQLFPVRNAG